MNNLNNSLYTILAVDDHTTITTILGRVLRSEGYHVITTQNPLEVGAILAKQRIDILLSDIEMPGINGLDLIALVRREFPAVLRILLTGNTTTESLLVAINDGQVFRYLEKPINPQKLLITIAEATTHLKKVRQAEALLKQAHHGERLLSALELEHPEILKVDLKNGSYILDIEKLKKIAQKLEHPLAAFIHQGTESLTDSSCKTEKNIMS
jgi:DNA-binding NtrC family response regulator